MKARAGGKGLGMSTELSGLGSGRPDVWTLLRLRCDLDTSCAAVQQFDPFWEVSGDNSHEGRRPEQRVYVVKVVCSKCSALCYR